MSSKGIKRYTFDLSKKNIGDRFAALACDKWLIKAATKLTDITYEQLKTGSGNSAPLASIVKKITTGLFKLRGTGDLGYNEEMEIWAAYMGRDKGAVVSANLAYELSQVSTWSGSTLQKIKSKIGFCSSVAFYLPAIGMVHARNMDWELEGIRKSTILIDYINGPCGDFTAVSIPGMVGVLSGVAKGRFSATINLAPSANFSPNIISGWSILLLLRYAFEYCDTYEDAVEILSNATSVAPAFVQVVGAKRGQACVIEIFPKGTNGIYKYAGKPLGITNHYLDSDYMDKEWEEDGETWCTNSGARLEIIETCAAKCKAKNIEGCLLVLRKYPVLSEMTQQSMVMCAKTGEVLLNDLE